MFVFDKLFDLFLPWIVFLGMIFTFFRLYFWARNKKTGAFIFAALMQMALPDPYAERTIKIVKQEKKPVQKKQVDGDYLDADGSLLAENKIKKASKS